MSSCNLKLLKTQVQLANRFNMFQNCILGLKYSTIQTTLVYKYNKQKCQICFLNVLKSKSLKGEDI